MNKPFFKDKHWHVQDKHGDTKRFSEKHLAFAYALTQGFEEPHKDNVVYLQPPLRQHHFTRPTAINDNLRAVQRRNACQVFMRNFFWTTVFVFLVVSIYGMVIS